MPGELDAKLQNCGTESIIAEFTQYKEIKTDLLDRQEVKIQTGVDGVHWSIFEQQLEDRCRGIARRLREGTYRFHPFREVKVPKDQPGEFRTLSIACLGDVLIQRILYKDVLSPFAEKHFSRPTLDKVSFAYRPGKSAPAAVRLLKKYMHEGYGYVLDADIEKFFDMIPHDKLLLALQRFFGEDNPKVQTLLRRFVKVDGVTWESYRGDETIFTRDKPDRYKRSYGIPQGGVLSGLVANIYLYDFDQWIVNDLGRSYDLKYIRYADDFVILLRRGSDLVPMREAVRQRLKEMGLTLHSDEKKTKFRDLSVHSVDFVGFSVSPKGIRVKQSNIRRFKERVAKEIWDANIRNEQGIPDLLRFLRRHLFFKLLGNEASKKEKICENCQGYLESNRNWMAFFLTITDVRQLRALDRWIRKLIHQKFYRSTGNRLHRKLLRKMMSRPSQQKLRFENVSLESIYYRYRKQMGKIQLCSCQPQLKLISTVNSEALIGLLGENDKSPNRVK